MSKWKNRQVITSTQVDFSYLTTLHRKYLRQVLASARYGQNVKEEVFGMVCGSQSSWLGFDYYSKLFLPFFELKKQTYRDVQEVHKSKNDL